MKGHLLQTCENLHMYLLGSLDADSKDVANWLLSLQSAVDEWVPYQKSERYDAAVLELIKSVLQEAHDAPVISWVAY